MAAEFQREVENKFDVAPDFTMPDLSVLAAPTDTLDVSTVALISTYFDTPSGDLLRFNLTLRRRNGDADTGWHLKVPGAGFRTELRWPLTEDEALPEELRRLLEPLLSPGSAIAGTVRLRVQRTRYRVVDASSNRRFEVADDQVRADKLGADMIGADTIRTDGAGPEEVTSPAYTPRWREVEAELGPHGTNEDLKRLAGVFQAAGAAASTSSSKLRRALRGPDLAPSGAQLTVGEVVGRYVVRQCEALVAGHCAVSLTGQAVHPGEQPNETVHDMRVACRRLRATLRSFDGVIAAATSQQLDEQLRWLADQLGPVRDCQVLTSRLYDAVEELPRYLVVGPVAERIQQILAEELAHAELTLRRTMRGEQYAAVLGLLGYWCADPPLTDRARLPAEELRTELIAADKRLNRLIVQMSSPHSAETDLHRTRRGAKRARYAAEALKPAFKREAAALGRRAVAVQTALGEYQDAVVATDTLRHLADKALAAGEATFTYGVLVADQRRAAADAAREAMHLR